MQVIAQTGIGTTTPDPSAKLDVTSTNKGFLPPRVTLTSSTDATTIPSPATGLLVYNTGNNAGLRAGYYYWNGTDWTTIATPISAETVDYVSVLSTIDQTVNTNDIIKFNSIYAGNIPYDANTGKFSLTAGKTYRLNASVSLSNGNVNAAEVSVGWKNAAGDLLGNKAEVISASYNTNIGGNSIVEIVYTPLTNTTVSLDVIYASSNAILWNRFTYANIQQIGSSSIINPWVLSGTNTYNTTGNVGIGNNAPTEKLDVTGTLGVSGTATLKDLVKVGTGIGDEGGEINFAVPSTNTTLSTRVVQDIWQNRLRFFDGNTKGVYIDLSKAPTGVSAELMLKASGMVNAGVAVTLGDIEARFTTTGGRSLEIRTTGPSFSAMASAYTTYNDGYFTYYSAKSFTMSSTFGYPGGQSWGFAKDGDLAVYYLRDTTNLRFWRFTLMVGPGYNNNFISIERLH